MPVGVDIVDTFDLKNQRAPNVAFSIEAVPVMVPSKEPGISVPKLNNMGVPEYKEVEYVTVRQPGGADSVIFEVEKWFDSHLPMEVANGRMNPAFPPAYKKYYDHWKAGQEIPIEGTAIKLWPVATKAQVKQLTDLHILTVEDLATLPDDAVTRIGIGGVTLKQRAMAWMTSAQKNGQATVELVALKQSNDLLQKNLATVTEQLEELKRAMKDKRSKD